MRGDLQDGPPWPECRSSRQHHLLESSPVTIGSSSSFADLGELLSHNVL